MEPDTILCIGYARLPEGTTMAALYKVFGLGFEVDPQSGIIVEAQTTSVTKLGNEFLTRFFVNKNIETDFKDILEKIGKSYRATGSRAILAAAQKAYNEYLIYKKETNHNPSPEMNSVHRLVAKMRPSCRDRFAEEEDWVMGDY